MPDGTSEPKASPLLLAAANQILEAVGALRLEIAAEGRALRRELRELSDRFDDLEAKVKQHHEGST